MSNLTDRVKQIRQDRQNGEFEYRLQEHQQITTHPFPTTTDLPPMPFRPVAYPAQPLMPEQVPVDATPQDVDWSLLDLVRQSSLPPEDDKLLAQVEFELNDIEAKLIMIDFLKKMEKALRKRAKVLMSLIDKLEETRDELHEVGADTLEHFTDADIETLQEIIQDEKLDKTVEKVENKKKKPVSEKERLKEFAMEE